MIIPAYTHELFDWIGNNMFLVVVNVLDVWLKGTVAFVITVHLTRVFITFTHRSCMSSGPVTAFSTSTNPLASSGMWIDTDAWKWYYSNLELYVVFILF